MMMTRLARGARISTLATARKRRFAANFPGWGSPDAKSYLLNIPAGLHGEVTDVEQHGSAPYTRYAVRFVDGTHTSGLELGRDIEPLRPVMR